METRDVRRLKAEIRYLRNCLLEAYNAIPTLPCNSQDSWKVVSPIMRAIREYHTSYDVEFIQSTVNEKRKAVSAHLTRPITASELGGTDVPPVIQEPELTVKIDSSFIPKNVTLAKSFGF